MRDDKVKIVAIFLIAFFLTRITLIGLGIASMAYLPMVTGEEYKHLDASPVLDMWYRWDAGFYTTIALYGYDWITHHQPSADIAFLPLYPLSIRSANYVLDCSEYNCAVVNGLIISNVALLVALFLLFYLTKYYESNKVAYRSAWLLMLSPISIFLSGVYTEALFLCLSLFVFFALSKKQLYLAIIATSLACITRPVGLALYLPLLIYTWRQTGQLRTKQLIMAHIPIVVFGIYILFAGLASGDWLAYFNANYQVWNRPVSGMPWRVFLRYFGDEDVTFWGWQLSWLDLIFTMLYLFLAIVTLRRNVLFGTFALGAILIPIASSTLVAMPRYGAIVFPFYIVVAQWADRTWKQVLLYSMSVLLLVAFTARFVTWHWIA